MVVTFSGCLLLSNGEYVSFGPVIWAPTGCRNGVWVVVKRADNRG